MSSRPITPALRRPRARPVRWVQRWHARASTPGPGGVRPVVDIEARLGAERDRQVARMRLRAGRP